MKNASVKSFKKFCADVSGYSVSVDPKTGAATLLFANISPEDLYKCFIARGATAQHQEWVPVDEVANEKYFDNDPETLGVFFLEILSDDGDMVEFCINPDSSLTWI